MAQEMFGAQLHRYRATVFPSIVSSNPDTHTEIPTVQQQPIFAVFSPTFVLLTPDLPVSFGITWGSWWQMKETNFI